MYQDHKLLCRDEQFKLENESGNKIMVLNVIELLHIFHFQCSCFKRNIMQCCDPQLGENEEYKGNFNTESQNFLIDGQMAFGL